MERLEELFSEKEISHIRPFLWMRGEDPETVKRELDQIEACGIREICLESRPHPEFCGRLWWENLDFILPEAKKRGMKVWILDDDRFPTGHANGGFIRQPEKGKIYLGERHMDILGPCKSGAVLVECFIPKDGTLLGILAAPKPDGESLAISGEGILDLTDSYENGFVYFDLPKGPYRLFVLFTTRTGGGREDYVSLIDRESVRVLIDQVYETHYEHYKEYFGNTLAGFFSDEPELGNVKGYPFDNSLGKRDQRLPWSGELEARLRERLGEGFLFSLPALWYEAGETTKAVRSLYMDEMTALVRDCFSGQLGNWCREHGVEYIGHVIEDDNAHTRMGCSVGHYFREMEGQHMAGVDVVHHQIVPGFTEPVHQWIAGDRDGEFFHFGLAKLASSAAHTQKNKKGRALCEIFGNYGWAEGVSLMKWLTNYMLVRGINEFTPHAFSMKYPDPDCPPHFYANGNNPGFGAFSQLMKYMNRGAHLLSGGIPVIDGAVLYHAKAEWSGGAFMYFQKPGRQLMEAQLDYDIISEDDLDVSRAEIEEGMLKIGMCRYPCLILPFSECMDRRVAGFVITAAEQGLPVFAVDRAPEQDTMGEKLSAVFRNSVTVVSLEELSEVVKQVKKQKGLEEISLLLKEKQPGLRSFLVRQRDGLAVMYFNESVTESAQGSLMVQNPDYQMVTVYDGWNHKKYTFDLREGRMPFTLEPGEAVFLCFEKSAKMSEPIWTMVSQECLDLSWRVSMAEIPGKEFVPALVLEAGQQLPNLNGRGYFPDFAGIYCYEGEFLTEYSQKRGRVFLNLLEASDCVRIVLNGTDLGWQAGFPAKVEVTDVLIDGENSLVLDVATTLVWKRKDGASTHLQVAATGIARMPVLQYYESV